MSSPSNAHVHKHIRISKSLVNSLGNCDNTRVNENRMNL